MPLLAAADLQDHLMVASNDLDRLQRLLTDACDALLGHFYGATGELQAAAARQRRGQPDVDAAKLHTAMEHMAGAITAMQFQDMASQLVHHTDATPAQLRRPHCARHDGRRRRRRRGPRSKRCPCARTP